jgi:hypothetical protein
MSTLTDRDKRTLRLASVGIAVYLVLFFCFQGWKYGEKKQAEYRKLSVEVQTLKREIQRYEDKALVVQKLMDNYRMDPMKLSKATVVAEASAAIQKAASTGGVLLGPIRETPVRSASREMASMQMECVGPIPVMMSLLYRVEHLGFPLIIDSVQLTPENNKPGQVKLNMTIMILDFEQWLKEEKQNG